MRMRIWSATCAAIALGVSVGVLAQDPPAAQTPSQSPAAKKSITVAGCVAKAPGGPTGTTGAAGAAGGAASAKEAKFVLNNAAAAETAGTAGAAAPAGAIASEYKLDGDDAKLTPHVGHKVEITGTVAEAKGGAGGASGAPTLKVDSVKMVAPSCQ
jgi:hypothetical protein